MSTTTTATGAVNEIDLIELKPVPATAPKPEVKQTTDQDLSGSTYSRMPDDEFFKTVFYFSGMGTVIGSALSEGIHVDERYRGRAVDSDELPRHLREQLRKDDLPLGIQCREQVHGIADGLKNLRNLLDNVPTYTESYRPASVGPYQGDVTVDNPIHGHKFFLDNRRRDYRKE